MYDILTYLLIGLFIYFFLYSLLFIYLFIHVYKYIVSANSVYHSGFISLLFCISLFIFTVFTSYILLLIFVSIF